METTQPSSLSSQQRRTAQCQSRSDARFFVARCRVELAPGVNERALTTALFELVERHAILRAGFPLALGAAEPADAGTLHIVHAVADAQSRPHGKALIADGAHLEAFLSGEGTGRSLELRLPALVGDTQTLRNLVAELNASLTGGGDKTDSSPYALVSQWQQDLLREPEAQVGIAFWKTKLANPPAAPRLLVEDGEPAGVFSPQRVSIPLGAAPVAKARALAERLAVTPDAVFITAWKTLLARLADSAELYVGVSCAGRTDEALEKVIGPLARVLPLRLPFQRDIPLRSAIEETDRHLFDAKAWEECFADDGGASRLDSTRLPAFVFEMPEPPPAQASAPLRIVDEYSCHQNFRLRLTVRGDVIDIDFDGSCLRAADAQRIGTAYVDLLDRLCTSPELGGGAVELISADERDRLLREVCFGPEILAALVPVHERFVSRARDMPDRIAIATTEGAISFAQLEVRSRRIAADLARRGIGAEASVALLADGSPGMIAAVLGILRAGAAFVPLDRLAPAGRHRAVIAAARPAALFAPNPAARALLEELAASNSLPLLDGEAIGDAAGAATALSVSVHAEHAAYILFTSGSTGDPKGIAMPHRALANHMLWIIDALGITEHDRLLQRTPLGFDASIWEVFAPLMTGACLVQCAENANFDVDGLIDTTVRCEVTIAQTVPGLLQALIDAGLDRAKSMRVLCCGGDAVSARLWNDAAVAVRGEPVNLYGPTETCIDASWWRGTAAAGKSIPIGRPISGAEMFVVDGAALAPTGVAGELQIGGAGLARGYIHQPRLTAAVFVPHPWSRSPGARVYRSGDFAFWDRDGVANFLGRKDDQVKLRGVRVQLEEIRAAMLQHPSVRDCLVTLPPAEQGRQELLAFVELQTDQQSGDEVVDDWRRHLRARLSDVNLPTHFVVLAAMPRTASGKLDRNALASLRATPQRNAPRTPTEQKVAAIWLQLLNLREIDTEQNFFALGGHSLLLTKVVARVAEELDVQVPLRGLFDAPTLAGFAAMIDSLKKQPASVGASPRGENSREPQTI